MSKKLLKILGSFTAIAISATLILSNAGSITASASTFLPASMTRLNLLASYATSQTAVYFSKPANWGENINAYVYNSTGNNAKWPGAAMTKQADGTYSYEVPSNLQDGVIIFNEGSNQYPESGKPGVQIQLGMLFKDGDFTTYSGGSGQTTTPTTTPATTTIAAKVEPTIDKVDVTSNGGTTQIKVTASGGEVGNNKLFYKFIELDQNGQEVKINQNNKNGQNYSLSNAYSISTPQTGTTHSVKVLVQNSNNQSTSQVVVAKAPDTTNPGTTTTNPGTTTSTTPLSNVNITSESQSINLGSKIKLSANATGGVGTLNYQYFVAQPGGQWSLIDTKTTSSTIEYTPSAEGTYYFYVNAIDSNGNTQVNSKLLTVTVNKTTTATDTTPGGNTSQPGKTFDNSSVFKVISIFAIAGTLIILSINKKKETN